MALKNLGRYRHLVYQIFKWLRDKFKVDLNPQKNPLVVPGLEQTLVGKMTKFYYREIVYPLVSTHDNGRWVTTKSRVHTKQITLERLPWQRREIAILWQARGRSFLETEEPSPDSREGQTRIRWGSLARPWALRREGLCNETKYHQAVTFTHQNPNKRAEIINNNECEAAETSGAY